MSQRLGHPEDEVNEGTPTLTSYKEKLYDRHDDPSIQNVYSKSLSLRARNSHSTVILEGCTNDDHPTFRVLDDDDKALHSEQQHMQSDSKYSDEVNEGTPTLRSYENKLYNRHDDPSIQNVYSKSLSLRARNSHSTVILEGCTNDDYPTFRVLDDDDKTIHSEQQHMQPASKYSDEVNEGTPALTSYKEKLYDRNDDPSIQNVYSKSPSLRARNSHSTVILEGCTNDDYPTFRVLDDDDKTIHSEQQHMQPASKYSNETIASNSLQGKPSQLPNSAGSDNTQHQITHL